MTNKLRYGMKVSTVRYWQGQAEFLYRANGVYMGRQALETRPIAVMPARDIAHAAIALAFVASVEHVRAVFDGTRGRRWSL